tara:strand:+ start:3433 stop:3618 length:186 start_codon:yes stop_codon:yes gene_type:complete
MKRYMLAMFFIGIVWGWGLVAITSVILDNQAQEVEYVDMEVLPISPIIPVEIYKLEREKAR